jgi:hypothetical protein
LINPDPDFGRDFAHNGSVVAQTYEAVQTCIDEFYHEGRISSFNTSEKIEFRKTIITETIGFDDGLNHLRAARYLAESLKRTGERQKRRVFRFDYFLRSFNLHVGSLLYIRWLFLRLPKFKKTVWAFDRWKLKNIAALQQKYYPFLDEFYKKKEGLIP